MNIVWTNIEECYIINFILYVTQPCNEYCLNKYRRMLYNILHSVCNTTLQWILSEQNIEECYIINFILYVTQPCNEYCLNKYRRMLYNILHSVCNTTLQWILSEEI